MNAISTSTGGMMRAMAQFDRSAQAQQQALAGQGDLTKAVVDQKNAELAMKASAATARTAADLEAHVIDIIA